MVEVAIGGGCCGGGCGGHAERQVVYAEGHDTVDIMWESGGVPRT